MKKILNTFLFSCTMIILLMPIDLVFAQEVLPEESTIVEEGILPPEFSFEITLEEIQDDILNYIKVNNLNIEIGTEEYLSFMYSILYGEIENLDEVQYTYYNEYASKYVSEAAMILEESGANRNFSNSASNGDLLEPELELSLGELRRENLIREAKTIAKANPIPEAKNTRAVAYSVARAQEYAKRYALSWNYVFGRYSSDCTNFASQVISYANFPMVKGKWQYNGTAEAKKGWNVALNFTEYWTFERGYNGGMYTTRAQVNGKAKPGDVLAYRSLKSYNIWHCAFVQSKKDGYIYISQHTDDYYNVQWNTRVSDAWMKQNNVAIINFSKG